MLKYNHETHMNGYTFKSGVWQIHIHRIDKYLDTLLANLTAHKALPSTTAKRGNRNMADCPSYY